MLCYQCADNKTIIQLNLAEYEYPLILINSDGLVVKRYSARFRKIILLLNTRRIGYMIVLLKTREYPTTPKVTLKRVDTRLHRYKVVNTTPSPPEYYRGYAAQWLRSYAATWLRGYVATQLRGCVATRLRGYAATRLLVYVASHTKNEA